MGSYTELYIDDYPVLSSKSYVDPEVMTLFTESDKAVFTQKVSHRNPLVWGRLDDEEERFEKVHYYKSSVKNTIERLEVMGYTMAFVKHQFEKDVNEWKSFLLDSHSDELHESSIEEYNFLNTVTIDDFIAGFKELRFNQVPLSSSVSLDKFELSTAAKYLASDNNGWMLKFPCNDVRSYIRAFLASCSLDSDVVQDITEVTHAGYYNLEDKVRDDAIDTLLSGVDVNSKIIVLTEGSSDKSIIERSLKLLYPHLADYYRFMDFGLANASGGASALVSQVKGFVGVGISNKIVALLDNDTAAYVAKKSLEKINLPANIRVLHYPNLSLAENYPTIGPTGKQSVNINNLAGSIELYLGEDVLKESGEYTLVEWHGFDKSLGRYQGELLNKKKIQEKFYQKIAACEKDRSQISQYDWSGMQLILTSLFTAFEPN
ncbi:MULTISPECIES: HEPN/Toprim-associated domain-containing protein [unclassified Psychrobacter]|uniref:HEPN/Toprim-associated domain-containing protein n=1 Tax=unclassified Psychrobacter TaxID=196806 RepID=UPI0018F351BB|nr:MULTISPECIES: HEPN/Toprim-associated domain-containing protein [unclassified Psychrobacter]